MAGGTLTASVVKDPASATNNIAVDASGNATIGNNLTVTALSTTNTLSVTGAASVGSTASVTGLLTVGASGIKFNDNTTQTTASSGGMTLLGTITTTSGTSQSLTSLVLTNYKQLIFVLNGCNAGSASITSIGGVAITTSGTGAQYGQGWNDLTSGGLAMICSGVASAGSTGYTTATTSVTVSTNKTFAGGSVLVYGVK